MIENQNDTRITAYLLNEMSPSDRSQFESEMLKNEDLRLKIEEQRTFIEILCKEFSQEFSPQLDFHHRAAINKKLYGSESVSFFQRLFSPKVGLSFATMSLVIAAIWIIQPKLIQEPAFEEPKQVVKIEEPVAPSAIGQQKTAKEAPMGKIVPEVPPEELSVLADRKAPKKLEESADSGAEGMSADSGMEYSEDDLEVSGGASAEMAMAVPNLYRVEFSEEIAKQFLEVKSTEENLKNCLQQNVPQTFSGSIKIIFTFNFDPSGKLKNVETKDFDKTYEKLVSCATQELTSESSKVFKGSAPVELPVLFFAQ